MQRKVVAIVEDDPSVRKSLERLLSTHGFATESFESAEAFLGRSKTTEAACIVIDIHLTGISGIELRHHLTASRLNFSVIFITAADDEQTHEEAVGAGCIACLQKPFSAELLINAIYKAPGYERSHN
jgi:FixJ family two-component response regulator